MLVTMKRQVLDSLDPAALGWACIEPTLQQIHGKKPTVKSQVLAQLTPGQQALFLFRVLYDHAGNSAADLYCWVSYLLKESETWSAIKAGSRYFGDDAMLQLLEEIEGSLEAMHPQGDAPRHDALPWDLDDDLELFASMSQLNATFHNIAPETLKLIGEYIRNNPSEFVLIEDITSMSDYA